MDRKTYFVYQTWDNERLYMSKLSKREADIAWLELRCLIENGLREKGIAAVGDLDDPNDFKVAQNLGLIDKAFKSHNDYMRFYYAV